MPTRVRTKEFQLAWLAKFGVQVVAREPASGEVLSAKCLFCEQFGREGSQEDEQSRKRKRTANVQHFKRPWRGDNIKSHLLKQHAQRFESYSALTLVEKSRYFHHAAAGGASTDVDVDTLLMQATAAALVSGAPGAQDDKVVPAAVVKSQPPPRTTAVAVITEGEEAVRDPIFAAVDAAEGMSRLVESASVRQIQHRPTFASAAAQTVATGAASVTAIAAAAEPKEADFVVEPVKRDAGGGFQLLVDKKIAQFVHTQLLMQAKQPQSGDDEQVLPGFELQNEAEQQSSGAAATAVDLDTGRYLLRVDSARQFDSTLKYLVAGFSPQRCAELVLESETGEPLRQRNAALYHTLVTTHCRYICAMNCQAIATALRSAWAFSLVLGANATTGDVTLRVRFAVAEKLHDVHLATLPFDEKSPDAMIQRATQAAAVVCDNWQTKLVGIAVDASASMAGDRHVSVFAFLQQAASSPGCYAVWSGARHVEAVVQDAFSKLCNDRFITVLVALTGYLQRRKNHSIGSSCCPMFVSSEWTSLRGLLAWFVDNSAALRAHFEREKSTYAPDAAWWAALYSLKAVVTPASACLLSMEGLTTHGAEQNRAIEKLLITLVADGYVDGPSRFQESSDSVVKGEYRVTHESAEMFIRKQEPFVEELLAALQEEGSEQHTALIHNVATMLAEAANELGKLRSERVRMTGLSDILPAVRPQDLAKSMSDFDFSRLVSLQRDRLKLSLDDKEIQKVKDEFKELLAASKSEEPMKRILNALPVNTNFSESWRSLSDRFPSLCRFSGGIASVYRDDDEVGAAGPSRGGTLRGSAGATTTFATEATLHARHFETLQRLANGSAY
ncbi:hypothetical protein Gpo141_00000220 [Globisporangium polare]